MFAMFEGLAIKQSGAVLCRTAPALTRCRMTAGHVMGFAIDAVASITDDGRFGRCQFVVYGPPADDHGRLSRLFALEVLVDRAAGSVERSELEAAARALAQGSVWLERRMARLGRGKQYHLTVLHTGTVREWVTELPA